MDQMVGALDRYAYVIRSDFIERRKILLEHHCTLPIFDAELNLVQ